MTGTPSRSTRSSLEDQAAYWRTTLSSNQSPLKLPFDAPRPPVQTFIRSSETITLDSGLWSGLRTLSETHGVVPFAALLAGLDMLLARFSGQERVAVGTLSVDSLSLEQREFVNPVVLDCDLADDPTGDQCLQRVAGIIQAAAEHRDYPFDNLVKEQGRNLPPNYAPFFQVLLVLCDAPSGLSDRSCTSRDLQAARLYTARCDLALVASKADDGLRLKCDYDAELFDAQTIRRLLASFRALLESLVAAPTRHMSTLPMLTEDDRHALLVEKDATAADRWDDQTLHRLVEDQAARTPAAIALTFEDRQVSYAELNAQSNQLARSMIAEGVTPGQAVALMLPTSPLQIAMLLAVLKAGCAFVYLDPDYPTERLKMILDEVRPPLLVADVNALAKHAQLAEQLHRRVIAIDPADVKLADYATQPTTNLNVEVAPGALAYIVYTSGSTGRPKGIMQSHGSFAQFTAWFGDYFGFGPASRLAQWASITYDASYCEIFGALCFGATLCLAPRSVRFDPALLIRWVADQAITMLQVVPSFAKQILRVVEEQHDVQNPFPELAQLLLAGEVLSSAFARSWLQRFQNQSALFNLYGPTECVLATYYPVTNVPLEQRSIPVGYAIDGRQILILDRHGALCPIGVEGEIYVRSRFLTNGYFQRPDETAAAFVQNPLHNDYPDPVYRTRDRGRWLPSGEIEFFGRADNLVKLHGMRVELEEIEAALSSHEAVRECAVVYRSGENADGAAAALSGLAAYVVLRRRYGSHTSQNPAMIKSLKSHLLNRLPEYMVPAAFVFLEKLPVTPNGKVDRKALPAPGQPAREEKLVAPRTPTEQLLAGIWAEVLGLDKVGINDNFFALGGHSLLATQVISRVRTAFQIELSFRALFKMPKVASLARWIDQARAAGQQLVPIERVARDGELPLSSGQQRLWILDQLFPHNSAYNILAFTRLQGRLNLDALQASVNEVVRRHEVLRTTFGLVREQPVQVIAPALNVPTAVFDLADQPDDRREAEARRIATDVAAQCFDLAAGPLLRAALIRLSESQQLLLLVVHHIVSDEWSMGILLKELGTLYSAFARDESSPLPELSVQYVDYAVWQRDWLNSEVMQEQLGYWKRQLENSPPVLGLPIDYPRSPVPQIRGVSYGFALSAALTESLRALSRQENVTLFMLLLAAFKTMLFHTTGQGDIVVGSPIANRNRRETEPLIGFFVNMLVLRTQVSGEMTFRNLLVQVRETCLGGYAHQDLPFEKLVAELRTERSSSHTPLFQVLFVLQNAVRGELELPGITVEPYTVDFSTAKFDLNMYFTESGDRLTGVLEYNADLFKAGTIERLVAQLLRVLEEVTANPTLTLDNLVAPAEAFAD